MVVKAAPETALDPYPLMEAVQEAGLPPGVLNVLSAGRETSEYLVKHPGVDKVSFTGSSATGARIGALCGERIKRCTLELGGKSAAIILEDVDLATAVPQMLGAGLLNNGQACAAQTRFLAPRSRYEEVVDGDGRGHARHEGRQLARPGHADRPGRRQAPARQDPRLPRGGKGGGRQGSPPAAACRRAWTKGWFIEPTLFYDVDNRMTIAREEIFGPVLVVIPYDDEEQAIAIANDSDFGLGGGVWCGDNRARRRGRDRRIRTGAITVNTRAAARLQQPLRRLQEERHRARAGPEGIAPYTEYQSIILPMGA